MNKLFVIGNGFDLAHRLRTSYDDFRAYLISQYPNSNYQSLDVPEGTLMPDGDISYDDDVVAGFLLYMISSAEPDGNKWSDLENSLGVLDFGQCFDDLPEVYDSDGDRNPWHEAYNNEDRAADLVTPALSITRLFPEWVASIDISSATKRAGFARLIDRQRDHFLTFNYTETLESLYGVEKVCHIHGKRGEELVFGHGNNASRYEEEMSRCTGAEAALQQIHDGLKKDTRAAIKEHRTFFEDLSRDGITRIFSYGFSFSDVDSVYLREICRQVATAGVTWFLHEYDCSQRRAKFRRVLRDCGFLGAFGTYSA